MSQLVADYLFLITQSKAPKYDSDEAPAITRALRGILRNKKVSEKDYKKYCNDSPSPKPSPADRKASLFNPLAGEGLPV